MIAVTYRYNGTMTMFETDNAENAERVEHAARYLEMYGQDGAQLISVEVTED